MARGHCRSKCPIAIESEPETRTPSRLLPCCCHALEDEFCRRASYCSLRSIWRSPVLKHSGTFRIPTPPPACAAFMRWTVRSPGRRERTAPFCEPRTAARTGSAVLRPQAPRNSISAVSGHGDADNARWFSLPGRATLPCLQDHRRLLALDRGSPEHRERRLLGCACISIAELRLAGR